MPIYTVYRTFTLTSQTLITASSVPEAEELARTLPDCCWIEKSRTAASTFAYLTPAPTTVRTLPDPR